MVAGPAFAGKPSKRHVERHPFSQSGREVFVGPDPLPYDDRETYTEAHVGLPEWGGQHTRQPSLDDSRLDGVGYRQIAGFGGVGTSLAARLTLGAMAAWNWNPFFLYMDRHEANLAVMPGSTLTDFHQNIWDAYRAN